VEDSNPRDGCGLRIVGFTDLMRFLLIDDPDAGAHEIAGDRPQNPIVVDSNPGSPVSEFENVDTIVDDAIVLSSPTAGGDPIDNRDDYAQNDVLFESRNREDAPSPLALQTDGKPFMSLYC
jgi:hypothetical protein